MESAWLVYNKIFASILDSSIWLEEPPTKVVWVTLLAAMDQDGFAHFSAIENLARRAVLSIEDTDKAVKILEAPDPNSADKQFNGRRIERVPGGWLVLNAKKYHDLSTRAVAREKLRKRVAKYRLKKRVTDVTQFSKSPETKTGRNNGVTPFSKNHSENRSADVTLVKHNQTQTQTQIQTQRQKPSASSSLSKENQTASTIPSNHREIIDRFNEKCAGIVKGGRRVTKCTERLAKAIRVALNDAGGVKPLFDLFDAIADDRVSPPLRNKFTLTGVLWDYTKGRIKITPKRCMSVQELQRFRLANKEQAGCA